MEGLQSAQRTGPLRARCPTPPGDPLAPSPEQSTAATPQAEPAGRPTSSALHSGLVNEASEALNARLPALDTLAQPHPVHPFRAHIRTPTAIGGLHLQTDLVDNRPSAESRVANSPATLESHRPEQLYNAVSSAIPIENGYLRTAASTGSMAGSFSPGSALSSPMLNALSDLTPLPSPLVMSDSPWAKAGSMMRPRSRCASNASLRDDPSFAVFGNGTLSPSPSLKKKAYQRLRNPSADTSGGALLPSRRSSEMHRGRSVSELVSDSSHNGRGRHVTISNTAPEQIEDDTQPHLHREAYLAAQRGLVTSRAPSGIPTPPASNASTRSVTESESEEGADDDKIEYITVRHGKGRKLYRPVRKLGQGTFSKVYLATSEKRPARDPLEESTLDPHQLVAIKVVEHGPAGGADEERVEISLKREVEILRSISHPSIVHMRAFDNGDRQALIVIDYCPGGDMFDVASAHGDNLTPPVVQRIFAELVSAVRYLHEHLIVHRDIKLENVLLNIPPTTLPSITNPQSHPYPLITLTDLGLSRRIPPPPDSPLLTTRCGSDDYAAPEILLGQPYDGRATDAWALGVLLYALMEGRLPFDPPPGRRGQVAQRSRALHRIARCDWGWFKIGNADEEWDPEKGKAWGGAHDVVEGLLKKVTRGRKSVQDIEEMEWVKNGITVEGGIRKPEQDDEAESTIGDEDR